MKGTIKSLTVPKILPVEYPPPIPAPHTRTGTSVNRLVRLVANTVVGPQQQLDFAYDHQGRRTSGRVCSNTAGAGTSGLDQKLRYDGWNLVAVLGADNSLLRSFVWGTDLSGTLQGAGGVGGPLGIYDLSTLNNQPSTHFASYDGNGNVTMLVTATNGTETARYEYGPFGEVIRATGPMAKANTFQFSTPYPDDETDLLYYGYRYYNASTGRWINRDPLAEAGGLNLQAFVSNDPEDRVDKLGLTEGYFLVSPWPVPLFGGEADKGNIPDGDTMPGFRVRYHWDKNVGCSCESSKIVLVQAIGHDSPKVRDRDPVFDTSKSGPLPGGYSGRSEGNLIYFDAPWNRNVWPGDITYTVEVCALCRGCSEKMLGCAKFTWTTDGHQLNPGGSMITGGPTSFWNDPLNRWNATHAGVR